MIFGGDWKCGLMRTFDCVEYIPHVYVEDFRSRWENGVQDHGRFRATCLFIIIRFGVGKVFKGYKEGTDGKLDKRGLESPPVHLQKCALMRRRKVTRNYVVDYLAVFSHAVLQKKLSSSSRQ